MRVSSINSSTLHLLFLVLLSFFSILIQLSYSFKKYDYIIKKYNNLIILINEIKSSEYFKLKNSYITVMEVGDDIERCLDKRTLVIANHQSTGDVPLLMACFNTKKTVLPNIMWIMDSLFKYTNFGIVSVLHQDFFIMSVRNQKYSDLFWKIYWFIEFYKYSNSIFQVSNLKNREQKPSFIFKGKDNRDKSLGHLYNHLMESYVPRHRKWMVLFPEGGFLRKRRAVSQRYAAKNNLPLLNNVSLPRVGALQAIMNTLGPMPVANNNSSTGEGSIPGLYKLLSLLL